MTVVTREVVAVFGSVKRSANLPKSATGFVVFQWVSVLERGSSAKSFLLFSS
jgi:hypothetical protein